MVLVKRRRVVPFFVYWRVLLIVLLKFSSFVLLECLTVPAWNGEEGTASGYIGTWYKSVLYIYEFRRALKNAKKETSPPPSLLDHAQYHLFWVIFYFAFELSPPWAS